MGCRNARRRSELEKRGRAHGPTNTEVTWSPRSGLRYLNIVRGGVVIPARNRAAGVRERVRTCCSWRLLRLRWTHLSAIRPFRIRGGLHRAGSGAVLSAQWTDSWQVVGRPCGPEGGASLARPRNRWFWLEGGESLPPKYWTW